MSTGQGEPGIREAPTEGVLQTQTAGAVFCYRGLRICCEQCSAGIPVWPRNAKQVYRLMIDAVVDLNVRRAPQRTGCVIQSFFFKRGKIGILASPCPSCY